MSNDSLDFSEPGEQEVLGGWSCQNCGHEAIRHLTTGACDYGSLGEYGPPDESPCDCPLLEHPA